MKTKIARVCLALSVLLFIFGMMMLCDCAGEFLLSGLFALVAVLVGAKRIRVASMVVLISATVMAAMMM
jgi:hypothetical protein